VVAHDLDQAVAAARMLWPKGRVGRGPDPRHVATTLEIWRGSRILYRDELVWRGRIVARRSPAFGGQSTT